MEMGEEVGDGYTTTTWSVFIHARVCVFVCVCVCLCVCGSCGGGGGDQSLILPKPLSQLY